MDAGTSSPGTHAAGRGLRRTRTSVSIIIPLRNEAANIVPVLSELRALHPDAEIIAIDDASSDASFEILSQQPGIVVRRLPRPLGQSAALYCGLRLARGEICVLIDGDGQSSAPDIKRLLAHFPEYDFVSGWRKRRRDDLVRRMGSRVANAVRNFVLHDGVRDAGGTPRAMKRECVDSLLLFDGMHRFIPALLKDAGFRTLEIPVDHRTRLHGHSNYSLLDRLLRGLRDLFGVRWLLSRRIDPARLCAESERSAQAARRSGKKAPAP